MCTLLLKEAGRQAVPLVTGLRTTEHVVYISCGLGSTPYTPRSVMKSNANLIFKFADDAT